MKGQSYHVMTVLEQYDASRKKTFLAFKDSPGNPLGRSPLVIIMLSTTKNIQVLMAAAVCVYTSN